ncbi:MAG: rRNA maturation RNase YbeY [Candidatus Azobacteroides sp.]|nr:rRNA maturation RNase YbeY [Candidatus Azobacteroides sp.]
MAIVYEAVDSKIPKIKRRETTRWIKKIIARFNKETGDITYVFCSDAEILRINQFYLKHDYYTDIITFDYSEGDKLSGDLFISLETVRTNSEKFKTGFDDELRRVMIHGVLHLCGYEDKTPEKKKIMREKEDDALRIF